MRPIMKFQPLLCRWTIFAIVISSRSCSELDRITLMRSRSMEEDRGESSTSVYTRSRSVPSSQRDGPDLTWPKPVNLIEFSSVSRFEGIDDFYLYARRKNKIDKALDSLLAASAVPAPQMNRRIKWSICKSIFCQSQYADTFGGRLIHPKTAKTELKRYNRDIFVDNFEKRWCMSSHGPWRRSRFVNQSISRTVHTQGNAYPETTFACVLQKLESPTVFTQFFVTEDVYDVNEVADSEYIGARFVFVKDADKNLTVHALAEEPADLPILSASELELLYLGRRKKYSPTVESKNDPVCGLDHSRKLRLCNVLSSKFRMWWRFEVVLQVPCKKRKVFFVLDAVNIRSGNKKSYKEWMLICKIVRLEQSPITFYVSRAYKDNEVFIFGVEVNLQYHGRRVSVVSDHDLADIPETDDEEVS